MKVEQKITHSIEIIPEKVTRHSDKIRIYADILEQSTRVKLTFIRQGGENNSLTFELELSEADQVIYELYNFITDHLARIVNNKEK